MPKYTIKFMPEYSSTSLWSGNDITRTAHGINIEYSSLNLSEALIMRLKEFDNRILGIIDWSDPSAPSPLTKAEQLQIYNEGVLLLEMVRKELGNDYEVIDEHGWIYPGL